MTSDKSDIVTLVFRVQMTSDESHVVTLVFRVLLDQSIFVPMPTFFD